MKRSVAVITLAAISMLFAGCLSAPFVPPTGAITQIKAPLDVDYDDTMVGPKQGTAAVTTILGLVSTGDASTQAAAKAGGITQIDHADYEYFNVLGIYQKTTVIVYGK